MIYEEDTGNSESEEKLYPGINKVVMAGVVQSCSIKDAKDADKFYNNFTLRVNEQSYNGKPYHLSIYCTFYGANMNIKEGNYLLIDGNIKCVDFGGEYKNIIDVKGLKKVFSDQAGVIASKRKNKKPEKTVNSLDDLPPMPSDDEVPF
jgi:hypothetical protein